MVTLTETNVYVDRKNTLVEQQDTIREEKRKMQLTMFEIKSDKEAGGPKEKSVPIVVRSSKFLTAEKKDFDKAMEKEKKAAEKP